MDKIAFVKLCSRSWSVRALALMAEGVPARVSPVAHAAGTGRTAMTTSFRHLVEIGLLRRASGHGHPLRPEFELTQEGERTARWGRHLGQLLDDQEAWQLIKFSWTLPVLAALKHRDRFNDLATALNPITDRALAQTLARLEESGWVERSVDATARPPIVRYNAIGVAKKISAHCQKI